MAEAVVSNLDDVLRAFEEAGQKFTNEKQAALRAVGQPIALQSRALAVSRIRNIRPSRAGGPDWSRFRVGSTRSAVYVAPVQRGTRDPRKQRKKLADRLLVKAMLPALFANRSRAERELDKALDRMEQVFNRG